MPCFILFHDHETGAVRTSLNTLYFPLYLVNVENEAKFSETTTMVISSNSAELGYPLTFLTAYYHQRDLTLGVFLIELLACQKINIFGNLNLGLHFQGNLLQELDDQTHCDHFGENLITDLLNDVVSEIFDVFSVFPKVTHFPPEKWGQSCASKSVRAAYFLLTSKTLIIIRKHFSNCLIGIRENRLCVFPLYQEKLENETKFLGKR